jgi:hypothetical protein
MKQMTTLNDIGVLCTIANDVSIIATPLVVITEVVEELVEMTWTEVVLKTQTIKLITCVKPLEWDG